LRRRQIALAIVDGVWNARFSEVWIVVDDDQRFIQISRAYDLIATIARHGEPNLAKGQLVRACFLLKYASGGRARKLELRPPNVAIYDRDRDGAAAEAFLRANRFLIVQPGGAESFSLLEPV
jgi:hypothetical protein